MINKSNNIILLGFKQVGKSSIGKLLALKLGWAFIDLDTYIEQNYHRQTHQNYSCREIYQQHGEIFFRDCETAALRQVAKTPAAVIAPGGGAPLKEANQTLILQGHWRIHLVADADIVYTRIMQQGKPAYFPNEQDPHEFFQKIWREREQIYARLANLTIENHHSAEHAAEQILLISRIKESRGAPV